MRRRHQFESSQSFLLWCLMNLLHHEWWLMDQWLQSENNLRIWKHYQDWKMLQDIKHSLWSILFRSSLIITMTLLCSSTVSLFQHTGIASHRVFLFSKKNLALKNSQTSSFMIKSLKVTRACWCMWTLLNESIQDSFVIWF